MTFEGLVSDLRGFHLRTYPMNERDIETRLMMYLKNRRLNASSQVTNESGRFDIKIEEADGSVFCIEIKKNGGLNCVEQLDRYANSSEVSGLVLLCWRASRSLRAVMEEGKRTAKIPIELVEVRKNQAVF